MNISSLLGHLIELLGELDRAPAPPDKIVAGFFRKRGYLGSHDRRFISDAVFDLVRNRRLLGAMLARFLDAHPEAASMNDPPQRFLALYAVSFILQNPSQPSEQAMPSSYWRTYYPNIDCQGFYEWVRLHRGYDFPVKDENERLGILFSFPDWMVREWHTALGDDVTPLLESLSRQAPTVLRVNVLKASRADCQARLLSEGLETMPTRLSPVGLLAKKRFNAPSTAAYREGWYEIQDEGSQMVSLLAGAETGMVVIDACAGAGGKSLHLAEIMENHGEIYSIDVDQKKLDELQIRARRGKKDIIRPVRAMDLELASTTMRGDIVLVDAPCSGTGTIRRNPSIKWLANEENVCRHARVQLELLTGYSKLVRPGGRLIYSTCSILPQENGQVVDAFLESHPQFVSANLDEHSLPELNAYGLSAITLYPHLHGTDGFFVAAMARKE